MDLTALELGLRNRQLLQVKCFLRIQVETFRYFLTEELPRMKNNEERVLLLDKFFTHDWQNVINKIVSVAVVNMTGDYVSMMLAVSLLRAIIQSCNQLLLIIASINNLELDQLLSQPSDELNKHFLSGSSSLSSSPSYGESVQQSPTESNTIKERYFSILQSQFRSIKSHLERIYSVNIGNEFDMSTDSYANISNQMPKQEQMNKYLVLNSEHSDCSNNFESSFRASIETTIDKIPILQSIAHRHKQTDPSSTLHKWENIVQMVTEHVSNELKNRDITDELIDQIFLIISQTGLPLIYILFSMFIQTSDSNLRQKLLKVLLKRYGTIDQLDKMIHNESFKHIINDDQISFGTYLQIMSVFDLYLFCFRSKLSESENLEMSIEWVLNVENSRFALIKSFILPSLEEISNHTELFSNWKLLNQQIYGDIWQHVKQHSIGENELSSMISVEVLWQYRVDREQIRLLINWIEKNNISLPYCTDLPIPKNFEMCQRMIQYLFDNGSFHLRYRITQTLCAYPNFFAGYPLEQLAPEHFNFQAMLNYIGQSGVSIFFTSNDDRPDLLQCFFRDKNELNKGKLCLEPSLLVEYCLEHELYELLYLIFNRYRTQIEDVIMDLLQNEKLNLSRNKLSILRLLLHFNLDYRSIKELSEELIFTKSVQTMKYLYEDAKDEMVEDDNVVQYVVQNLVHKRQDIDLALLMFSFSNKITFEQFVDCIENKNDPKHDGTQTFYKHLNSKYPLISKAFEKHSVQTKNLSSISDIRHTTSLDAKPLVDLYYLLQHSIPYVNIEKFFQWQIKRRHQLLRNSSLQIEELAISPEFEEQTKKITDIGGEIDKCRLHLSLGKLIIEFAPDLLSVQGSQQQQSILASLLRKSHFNNERSSSAKLLELAVLAMERKYSKNIGNSSLNNRLHSLLHSTPDNIESSDKLQESHLYVKPKASIEDCSLLMECFDWRPLLKFANTYGLKVPFNFLEKCAREDNWLVFSIFAQTYAIPKDDIQAQLRLGIFNNQCIGEHLAKAFQSSSRLESSALSAVDSKLHKMKQAPNSSRNQLYSRLFKGKVSSLHGSESDSSRANEPSESEPLSTSSSPETFSIGSVSVLSKLSDDSNSPPLVLCEQMLKPESVCKDFLQLVLEIYQNCAYFGVRTNYSNYSLEKTFRATLLYASVSLSNPILSLLACSLDRPPMTPVIEIKTSNHETSQPRSEWSDHVPNSNSTISYRFKFTSFMCWLLSSVDSQSKQQFIDSYIHANGQTRNKPDYVQCFLQWSPGRSINLIDMLTQHNARVFITLHEGFKIFGLDIPILEKLLQFLINFFIERDYYQSDDLLIEFKSLLQTYNEDEFLLSAGCSPSDYDNFNTEEDDFVISCGSLRIFYSKNWIEQCSLVLITNSLLLAQQFELGILLSHYNFVRLQDSFSSSYLRIPDIRNLYFFSQCLTKLPSFTLPIADLLRHGPATSENENMDYADYVSIFRKLIFDLQEAGHFEEARNIINLLPKTNVNEFIINEWMLKAKKVNNNSSSTDENLVDNENVILDQIDLAFWENCWAQVTKLDPSMHSAFKVMERFVQHLQPNQVLIKCFVLLKCMLAIESILLDFIETNNDDQSNDNDSRQSLLFDDLSTTNLDLLQDYFQFEFTLWSSVVDCEFLIFHRKKHQNEVGNGTNLDVIENSALKYGDDSYDDHMATIITAWKQIWNDIVQYTKASSFSNRIMPKLSLKHTYYYKNINSKRNKQVITLDGVKHLALNEVIRKLLNSLCLQKAKEVSALFSYSHDDFEIIQACDNAAKGTLQNLTDAPFAVQFKIQSLESNSSTTFSNQSYTRFQLQNLSSQQKQTISLIETFINFATIGKKSCNLILLYYKISCILRIAYSDFVEANYSSLSIFQLLLSSNLNDQYNVSSDDTSKLNSFESRSQLDASGDDFDHDHCRESLDPNTSQSSSINSYMEAIACAKDLINIVGEQDEHLNTDEKVALQLANHTYNNVQMMVDRQFKDCQTSTAATEIEMDKQQLAFFNARFLVLIKLLHQPSILGHTLIDICKRQKATFDTYTDLKNEDPNVSKETQAQFDYLLSKRKHYVLLVELHIRAHECFTAQCDVHGIALVLRRTRVLITQELQSERYFHLILKLLTGIGRYSEMTYCFDLFRECDRFEMILSKRVQRTPQLRIALLNYLKLTDKVDELLPLVAIRFFLYRETADYHRVRAERLHNEICFNHLPSTANQPSLVQSYSNKFSNSPNLSRQRLENASNSPSNSLSISNNLNVASNLVSIRDNMETMMYEYQEAESNYTKASSHTNANLCSNKAQLIALQIAYINRSLTTSETNSSPTISWIIQMDSNQVRDFISQCTCFFEALIVSKAYPEMITDWTDAFFHNVILEGNMTYLSDFAQVFPISITLLKKLTKRYEQLCAAFKQQTRTYRHTSVNNQLLTNSPSSISFAQLLSTIRSESELQKARRILEQVLERFLCHNSANQPATTVPYMTVEIVPCNIKDKYRLAEQFGSPRIIQRLMETDPENAAYLLDLKRNNKL
ncbi:hypothetical protein BLOT_005833 [Blomia tropicalis]|nr:hypothetical protein BLOT_005833 [Blomia tropicalis]